jgi:hypothetical protein
MVFTDRADAGRRQARIGRDADELVCVATPRGFHAIGQFYANFPQVPDSEVIACLDRAAAGTGPRNRHVAGVLNVDHPG